MHNHQRLKDEGLSAKEAQALQVRIREAFARDGLGFEDIAVRLELDPVFVAQELHECGLWRRRVAPRHRPEIRVFAGGARGR
jgi:hypothetical protein